LSAFASYFAAEAVHVSGVLAAVACGGVVGRRRLELAAGTRLEGSTAWEFVEFVLTSLVFMLMGLQLRGMLERLTDTDPWRLGLLAAAASAALIVSRIVWVFATFYPAAALASDLNGKGFIPPRSYPTIISWAGMRGVVSLAAALALPAEFPGRDEIVFVVFCCILVSLILQGTTLAPLIQRWLAEFGQGDKWRVCLKAAMMPRIRSAHDEADPPDAQSGLQSKGGVGRHQGREDAGRVGAAV
jgi:monovalent cation/hydrogen antiporter